MAACACCSASLPNLVQLHELRQLLQHHVSLLRQQLRLPLPAAPMCSARGPVAVLGLSWLAGGVAGGRCRRRSRARDLLTDEPEDLRPAVVYRYKGANRRVLASLLFVDNVFTFKKPFSGLWSSVHFGISIHAVLVVFTLTNGSGLCSLKCSFSHQHPYRTVPYRNVVQLARKERRLPWVQTNKLYIYIYIYIRTRGTRSE